MQQTYLGLFMAHALLALLSPVLLTARLWRAVYRPAAAAAWLRGCAYLTDALLVCGGLALGWIIQQYPFTDAWLTAKLLGFAAYLLAGHYALRHARCVRARLLAWIAALAALCYVAAVAVTRAPAAGL